MLTPNDIAVKMKLRCKSGAQLLRLIFAKIAVDSGRDIQKAIKEEYERIGVTSLGALTETRMCEEINAAYDRYVELQESV